MTLITSMLGGLMDMIAEFFMALFNLLPKMVYLFYASLACVLDVLQLFFRKLAGLDVYYQEIDGELTPITGDIVTNFITGILGINAHGFTYPILSTVFWSMIVFGVILCFGCILVAIIKSHYSYDEKAAKGPMQYVYTGLKAVVNMVAVPIIIVLGLYVSQALLTALDSITSIGNGTLVELYGSQQLSENCESSITSVGFANLAGRTGTEKQETLNKLEASGESFKGKSYIHYDVFGFGANIRYGNSTSDMSIDSKARTLISAVNMPFSGSLFRVAAYNANRARTGQFNIQNSNYAGVAGNQLFSRAKTLGDDGQDTLAEMIDTAFACGLHLKQNAQMQLSYATFSSTDYSTRYFTIFNTGKIASFSKFNVGAIWYFYDLWNFNFIVGFGSIIICATLFINIILGLITRLFMTIGLFLVAPPVFGLEPLDGGNAKKVWTKSFVSQVLMAYGSVLGMNIFFLIFPYICEISFFNIAIADYFAQALVIIVGMITIKAFIKTLSEMIGAADAQETGKGISGEVGKAVGGAAKMTMGAARFVAKAPANAFKLGVGAAKAGVNAGKAVYHGARTVANAGKTAFNAAKTGVSALGAAGHRRGAKQMKNYEGISKTFDSGAVSKYQDLKYKNTKNMSSEQLKEHKKELKNAEKDMKQTLKDNGVSRTRRNMVVRKLKEKDNHAFEMTGFINSTRRRDSSGKVHRGWGYIDKIHKDENFRTRRSNNLSQHNQNMANMRANAAKTKTQAGATAEKAKLVRADAGKAAKAIKTPLKGTFKPLGDMANSAVDAMGSDLVSSVAKVAFPKEDPAKTTAKNTGETNELLQQLNDNLKGKNNKS